MSSRLSEVDIERSLASTYRQIWKQEENAQVRSHQLSGIEKAAEQMPVAVSAETVRETAVRNYLRDILEDNQDKISKKAYDSVDDALDFSKFVKAQNTLEEEGVDFERWRV